MNVITLRDSIRAVLYRLFINVVECDELNKLNLIISLGIRQHEIDYA